MPTVSRCFRTGLVLIAAWLASAAFAEDCVKSLRWAESNPYAFRARDGMVRGLHVDLITEAMRRMGCTTTLQEMPWARALLELKAGRLDVLAGAANLPEREAFAHFSQATNSARTLLFITRKARDAFHINKLTDTIGTDFRIAVNRDASLGDEYDELIKSEPFRARLTFLNNPESGWQMMAAGRVEGQITDEVAGLLAIKKLGLESVITRSSVITSEDADFVAFSKSTTDRAFVERFNTSLRSMLAGGSYRRILEAYLPCKVSMKKLGCN